MTTARDITIYQGQAFALSLDYAGTAGRGQRMHIRLADSTATVVQILTHNGDANARVLFDGAAALDITIGASVSAEWVVLADRVEWVYDIEDYDLADEDDCVIPYRGKVIVRGNRTRASDVTPSDQMPSGDGRYVRFDGVQGLSAPQQLQARENIGVTPGGTGDVVGPSSATDSRIAEFDGTTGKLIKQSSYTIAALIAYVVARAQHTGTQLASTISDFASAAIAAVTWSTITGKPSTFDPSAHKTNHATGGSDALTAADIGAATAGHDHTGTYQPLATVLTNTTASFTTADETKLDAIEALADVTDAGNVGTAIDGASAKTTPADADTVPLIDSAASNVMKKLSWTNIKATLKTYFDTLYQAVLVSGTNIKTVNSTSLLGSGDIAISASPGGSTTQLQYNNAGAFGGMNLWRESADVSAFRNGTTAETVYVYKTTDAGNVNYERIAIIPGAAPGWLQVAAQSAGTGAVNLSVAVSPRGTGALSAHVPDSTAAGGDARGAYAVDLNLIRASPVMVASGDYSVMIGGNRNTASALHSVVVGSLNSIASGIYSAIVGGQNNAASGQHTGILGGVGNLALAAFSGIVGGISNTASNNYAAIGGGNINTASGNTATVAGGNTNTASGNYSWVPGGSNSTTRIIIHAGAYGMTQRAAIGDRQTMVLPIACAARTDATPTVMTSDAGAASDTNQMVLPNNSAYMCTVEVVAFDPGGILAGAWEYKFLIKRGANAASTAIVGTPTLIWSQNGLSGGAPGIAITADTTFGCPKIEWTGIAATTTYPSGHITARQCA